MNAALSVVIPIFLLILAGYAAAWRRLLTEANVEGLSRFVFFFAIPALIFRGMAGAGLGAADADGRHAAAAGASIAEVRFDIVYVYFIGCLIVFAASMALSRLAFRMALREQALFGLGATFSNTVLMGVPVIYTALGERGVMSVTLITAFHSLILITLATVLIELGDSRNRGGGIASAARTMLVAIVSNPIIQAVVAGALWRAGGWPLPGLIDGLTRLLAGAATATSLVALGASLASFRIAGDLRQSLAVTAVKMVVTPLVIWWLAARVFELEPLQVAVATILASMPTGANVFILAQRYDVYVARSATIVLITTALSILTVTTLIYNFAAVSAQQ
jgi:hypothetical protein